MSHVYETVVRAMPEQVWQALTTPDLTQKYYFGCRVESDWQEGSPCRYYGAQGAVNLDGKILEITPQQRLVTTFEPKWVPQMERPRSLPGKFSQWVKRA